MASRRRHSRVKPTRPQRLDVSHLSGSGLGLSGKVEIPFTLPGDVVDYSQSPRPSLTFVEQSSLHQQPDCLHFGFAGGQCGGCLLQHMGRAESLAWKRERVLSELAPVIELPDRIEAKQTQGRDRRRARLAFVRGKGGAWTFGFRAFRQHRIVPMTECHTLHPDVFDGAKRLSILLAGLGLSEDTLDAHFTRADNGLDIDITGLDDGGLTVTQRKGFASFVTSGHAIRVTLNDIPLAQGQAPTVVLGDIPVTIPPRCFLQASKEGQVTLQSVVINALKGSAHVADLFCGIGTFALPAAESGNVEAFDSAPDAIRALKAVAPAGRMSVVERDLFRRPIPSKELSKYDAVVIDPPRAGARAQVEELSSSNVETIVMVSCNPATMAKDIARLSKRYEMSALTVVDQFLWSAHIEAVAILNLR